ncbi:MAG: ABC transporter permease [Alphaproteobacteria bacterium]
MRRRDQGPPWLVGLKRYQGISVVLVYGVFLAVCFVWSVSTPNFAFATTNNLTVLLALKIPTTAIAAIGVGLLMIAGEFDISTAGTYTLAAFIVAILFAQFEWPLILALIGGLVAVMIVGALNGYLTAWVGIPSFIATIGMMFFLRGVIRFVSINPESDQADSMPFFPCRTCEQAGGKQTDALTTLFTGEIVSPLYAQMVWLILIGFAAHLLLNRHRLGNHMFTTGGNRDAATAVGVNVKRTKLIAFIICATAAGFAGIMQATMINEIEPSFAVTSGFELKVIASVVVGGVSLMGGRGTVLGMILGAALIETVDNVLVLIAAPETLFKGLLGALIIAAVVLNTLVRGRR